MLRLGVPEYRLPRALIQLEINAILSLGVELSTERAHGKGLHAGRPPAAGLRGGLPRGGSDAQPGPAVPGMDLDGVLEGSTTS